MAQYPGEIHHQSVMRQRSRPVVQHMNAGMSVVEACEAVGTLPITFTWDFGEGCTATGEVVTHTFTRPGDHTVTVTAVNPCPSQTMPLNHEKS